MKLLFSALLTICVLFTQAQQTKLSRDSSPVKLSTVNVTSKRPLVEVKADKTVVNVEGTINATGSNALELLRRSPGVLLDKDDNISLAGKNGVQVYVDGRSTPLSGQDLATYLKTMQSTQIESIELITNPSAKYDAAGNAGIINIRLVKNKSLGTNGSVNAGVNIAASVKYNTGFSLNHRNKNMNLFSTYNYSYSPNVQHLLVKRTVLDSLFDQTGRIRDLRKSHNFKAGADYFIDKKNTVGIMVNGIIADPTTTTNSNTIISNTSTNIVNRLLTADNSNVIKRHNANINLNYNYLDPKGASFVVNADRGAYDFDGDQFQRNYYFDPAGQVKLNSVIYHMMSPSQININSIKADYERNFLKGKFGIGGKAASVKTDNDFQRFDVIGNTETLDKDRSNRFVYSEKINAGYVNYNRQYKSFMVQTGLRVENTFSEGMSRFKRTYTDLFPSGAITFNKNKMKVWSLTYSRRIDRPAYKDLNPFEFKLDEYTSMRGNVNLKPQYTNTFGITHTYKYKLNIGANYSHVRDMFTELLDTAEGSKAFLSKRNLATQDIINVTISYPFTYKNYSLFTSITSNYSMYKADFGSGRKVDVNAFGFNLFAQNSLKLSKTCTFELSGFYNAPTIYGGSFKAKALYNVDAGISSQILKGKATIKASVSDIFYSTQFRATSDFAGQVMNIHFRSESRQARLNFNYRFGNNGVKAARNRTSGAEEETKRVQGGGILGGN